MDQLCDKCGKLDNLCGCASGSESELTGLLAGYLVENTTTGEYQFFKELKHAHTRLDEWMAGNCGVSITNLYKASAC